MIFPKGLRRFVPRFAVRWHARVLRNNIRTTWGGQRDGVHLPGV